MNHQPVVRTFQEKIKFTIKIIHFNNNHESNKNLENICRENYKIY